MINQITNITGVQLLEALKSSEASFSGKPLPAKNSLVDISILGKTPNGYRLLIDGNVFQAKLPFGLNAGEFFLARVISTYPFTLSLDNLFANTGLSEIKLLQLLSRMNIRDTDLSRQLLKVIISSKKPVIKSRLEKLIDIIEKENLKLDDYQLQLMLQILDTNEHSYDQMSGSFAAIFQYSFNDLSTEILSYVNDLKGSPVPEYLRAEIDNALVVHITEDSEPDTVKMKSKTAEVSRLIISLDDFISKETVSESLRQKASGLLESLIRYTLLKANCQKAGIFQDFFIVENDGELEVFDYQFDRSANFSLNKSTGFNLKMRPDRLGEIFIGGYISGNSIRADFRASDDAVSNLEASAEELKSDLMNNIKLNPMISFISGNSWPAVKFPKSLQGINVSV